MLNIFIYLLGTDGAEGSWWYTAADGQGEGDNEAEEGQSFVNDSLPRSL